MSRFTTPSSPRIFGLGLVLAAAGLVQGSYWIVHAERAGRPDICVAWDEAAQRALAPLMHRQTVGTDRPLRDALAALRRARHECAAGQLELARRDYEVLRGISAPGNSAIAAE